MRTENSADWERISIMEVVGTFFLGGGCVEDVGGGIIVVVEEDGS